MRSVPVNAGEYIKIFGAIKPSKDGKRIILYNFFVKYSLDKSRATVIVHVIKKIESTASSVLSVFMLEAIQALAAVMGCQTQSAHIEVFK